MKKEYDLSKMKSRKNPYASKLKKPVTMRLGEDVINYFKGMAEDSGVPYQSLINLYLRDCISQHRKVDISWATKSPNKSFNVDCQIVAVFSSSSLCSQLTQTLGS